MAQFQYKARRRDGQTVTGVLEVADRGAALMQIERLGLFPLAVEMPKGGAVATTDKPSAKSGSWTQFLPPALRAYFVRERKPKLQELATFTNQLANLLKSGMPLTVALNSMTHLETKGIPSDVSRQLKNDVTEGKGLSEAMAKQPVIFSNLYINMVKAGETSGALVDKVMADAGRQEFGPRPFAGGGPLGSRGGRGGRVLGRFHRQGKQPQPFDLHQRRAAIGDFKDAGDRLAIAASRFVLKLGHKQSNLPQNVLFINTPKRKSCKRKGKG